GDGVGYGVCADQIVFLDDQGIPVRQPADLREGGKVQVNRRRNVLERAAATADEVDAGRFQHGNVQEFAAIGQRRAVADVVAHVIGSRRPGKAADDHVRAIDGGDGAAIGYAGTDRGVDRDVDAVDGQFVV